MVHLHHSSIYDPLRSSITVTIWHFACNHPLQPFTIITIYFHVLLNNLVEDRFHVSSHAGQDVLATSREPIFRRPIGVRRLKVNLKVWARAFRLSVPKAENYRLVVHQID